MNIRVTILVLVVIPLAVAFFFVGTHRPMNATVVALLGAIMIWLAYTVTRGVLIAKLLPVNGGAQSADCQPVVEVG